MKIQAMNMEMQVALVLIGSVLVIQLSSVWLVNRQRNAVLDSRVQNLALESNAAAVALLESIPPDQWSAALSSLSIGTSRYRLESEPFLERDVEMDADARSNLARLAGLPFDRVRIFVGELESGGACGDIRAEFDLTYIGEVRQEYAIPYSASSDPCVAEVITSLDLGALGWLNAAHNLRLRPRLWAINFSVGLGVALVVTLVGAMWRLWSITTPMRLLSAAAERLGRGDSIEVVPERGPSDIRRTIRAFNQMQRRVRQYVKDRTTLLSAISHDMRTPITSMRLRLDMMDDLSEKQNVIASLDELESIATASLDLIREDVGETRVVDLTALLASLCEDLAETGLAVTFESADRLVMSCNPRSLRRVFTNLIDNAVKYGNEAHVQLAHFKGVARVMVRDSGPGIPESLHDQVFEPFFRIENSRNDDTGGLGLGLAVVRIFVRNHGGQIRLENCCPGFQVVVDLPC